MARVSVCFVLLDPLLRYSGGGLGWGFVRDFEFGISDEPPPLPSPGVPEEGERPQMPGSTPSPAANAAPPAPAWDDALLQNPHNVADKRRRVQRMFAAIAPSYDLNNRLHSLWMDQAWRRKAVRLAGLKADDVVVDVACGTGDLSLCFATELDRLVYRAHDQNALH